MTGLLRLVFWLCFSVVLAYLMTDIKIGGKNIKERIDAALFSNPNATLSAKVGSLVDRISGGSAYKPPKKEEGAAKTPSDPAKKEGDITEQDRKELQNLINQYNQK